MPTVHMYPTSPSMSEEAFQAPAAEQSMAPLTQQVLRRSGKRPVIADVRLLAHATSYGAPLSYWYEVNLWQTSSGHYVSDIRLFRKADEESDEFIVESFEDRDDAIRCFESFNPRNYVTTALQISDTSVSTGDLAVQAIQLRHDLEVASRHYKSLLCTLLQDMPASA